MKPYPFKPGVLLVAALAVIASATICSPLGRTTLAEEAKTSVAQEPIRITADKLVTDSGSQTAEFSGNVKAVQGATEVNAQKLIVHYSGANLQNETEQAENISKIEAVGNVRIVFDNRVAVSDQAVYTTSDRRLILTGKGSRITSDANVITGSKIILDRNQDRMEIIGSEQTQVEAVLHSDQRGLN